MSQEMDKKEGGASAALPSLQQKYVTEVIPALKGEFGYKSVMQVPKLVKIVLSMGLGDAVANQSIPRTAQEQLGLITGQRPVITRARKSIANFKLREGMPIGCMVTLRRERMWYFLERLLGVALPRVRDFRGVSGKAFDGHGNYSMGLREQTIFPEIDYDKVDEIRGLNINFVTSARTDAEVKFMLSKLGMPFRN